MSNYNLRRKIDRTKRKLALLHLECEIVDINKQLDALKGFRQWYPPHDAAELSLAVDIPPLS